MQKIYIETENEKFYGYDCKFLVTSWSERFMSKLPKYCMYLNTRDTLETKIAELMKLHTVKEGASIHLLNSLPIAIEDLRAHYSIRRNADTADYNVFCYDSKRRYRYGKTFRHIVVCKEHKKAVCSEDFLLDYDMVHSRFPEVTRDECVDLFNCYIIWNYDSECVFPKILQDKYRKPTIPVECLSFSNPNELTMDTLQMTLMAAAGNDEQAFLTQLAILNQTNWSEYPGTMHYLRRFLKRHLLAANIYNHINRYSKLVNNILKVTNYCGCRGEKDFNLMRSLFNYVLGFSTDVMYVDFGKLVYKMFNNNLSVEDLARVYSLLTRVKVKEYEDEQTYNKAE